MVDMEVDQEQNQNQQKKKKSGADEDQDIIAITKDENNNDVLVPRIDEDLENKLEEIQQYERSWQLTAEYTKLEEGQVIRGIFLGIRDIQSKYFDPNSEESADNKKTVSTVLVLSTDKALYMLSGPGILQSVQPVGQGQPIEVEGLGLTKSGQGREYNNYRVTLLQSKSG